MKDHLRLPKLRAPGDILSPGLVVGVCGHHLTSLGVFRKGCGKAKIEPGLAWSVVPGPSFSRVAGPESALEPRGSGSGERGEAESCPGDYGGSGSQMS